MKKNRSPLKKMKYKEEEVVPNAWSSELPADMLGLISNKLRSLSLSEFIRLGSVCFEWRSFCIKNYQHIKLPSHLPVLLIPLSSPPISCPPTTTDDKKYILSPPSSPSPIEDDEEVELDDDDGEKEEVEDDGEDEDEDEDEEEEVEVDNDDGDGEEELEDDGEEEEVDDDDANDEDEDEDPLQYYYKPKDIWEGQDNKQRFKNTRNFYSLTEKRVYHDFPLPVPYYKNIRGSSHGWLVTVEDCCSDNGVHYYPVRLFNPFRTDNNEIQLPPLSARFKYNRPNNSYYLRKTCLSANPSSLSDLTKLVVLGVSWHSQVSFCKPGDKDWTHLEDVYEPINDIFCYHDQFYAILNNGYVFGFVFDAAQRLPKHTYTIGILPPQEDGDYLRKHHIWRYLVESNGELLQIRRDVTVNLNSYETCRFLVFKLDPMDPSKWVETKTLNDRMLFLGASCTSMSLSALDFPGCKPNSIYYTDDCEIRYISEPCMGPRDIGVFNVEDGCFEPYYSKESKVIMPAPIWIQPML